MFPLKNLNSKRRLLEFAIVAVVFTCVGMLIASNFNWSRSSHANTPQVRTSYAAPQSSLLSGDESPFAVVAEKIKPAVVNVSAKKVIKGQYHQLPFEFYFEDPFQDFFEFFRRSPREEGEKEREWRSDSRGSGRN